MVQTKIETSDLLIIKILIHTINLAITGIFTFFWFIIFRT